MEKGLVIKPVLRLQIGLSVLITGTCKRKEAHNTGGSKLENWS
jgi:hypothetical protein